jgi:hypothetical protein
MGIRICTDMQCVVDWLYTWQTLISGVLALGAAAMTVGLLRIQIEDERARHRSQRIAKTLAARATLPDALSDIARYTRECMAYLVGKRAEPPLAPADGIAAIKGAIEFCDGDPATALFALASYYQVQRARLAEHRVRRGPENLDRMRDCAHLRALSDRLFDYARGEGLDVRTGRPDPEEVVRALGQIVGPGPMMTRPNERARLEAWIRGTPLRPDDEDEAEEDE